jgi:RNA polymerase sigma factor (sigma-70 family)
MPFADLLRRAMSGESAAQSELFAAEYPRVRAIAHRQIEQQVGRNGIGILALFSTGDVVQEAFVAALRELPNFRGSHEQELVGWLAALVHNRVVDAMRHHLAQRRDRRRDVGDAVGTAGVPVASHDPTPTQALAANERAAAQAQILAGLDARDRELLHARLVDEAPWGEIAESHGLPSADAARFAFRRVQARLMLQLARAGLGVAKDAPAP